MPLSLPISAAFITLIVPGFLAANIFLLLIHMWVGRLLRTDPSTRERLRIDMADDTFGWAVTPGNRRRVFVPLIGTVFAAVALTIAETVMFGVASDVPRFWYLAGAIAVCVMVVLPFIAAGLFRNALGRRVDRILAQRANEQYAFALPLLFAAAQIDAQANELYASLGLRPRTRALADGRRIVLEQAGAGEGVVLSALELAKSAAERELRNLTSLVTEIQSGMAVVEQVRARPAEAESLTQECARVADATGSRALADALEAGRWSDAGLIIEKIRPDLDRLAAALGADSGVPRSLDDAYRALDVRDDTPLESIKTILSTYRRIWHPDRARDDAERVLFTLKTQRLNVAWDLIQRARGVIRPPVQATEVK